MSDNRVITLTTDFGYEDAFAGVMKGVILRINPAVKIVDLTHGIGPQDLREAAFTIGMNYHYFPEHTIHVVVVDPGVGSDRRAIIGRTGGHFFVGPDNGVFSYIYKEASELEVIHVVAEKYFLSAGSPTFQGRDVFAPVAAWLSTGTEIDEFGQPIQDYVTVPLPSPEIEGGDILRGEVIHIDRFGNAITNIHQSDIAGLGGPDSVTVRHKGRGLGLLKYYAQGAPGQLSALINSSGYLEFFVSMGNASVQYGIEPGDAVEVILTSLCKGGRAG